jgi:hypothetical protein
MKYIANILTNKQFNNSELFNVVDDKEKLIDNIPTLVIGWEYTKSLYKNANILNWEIDNNTYWTYGNREKRNKYESNIVKFKEYALNRFIKSVNYRFISIITIDNDEKQYLNELIKSPDGSFIYLNNDMVYILDKKNNIVVGFSMRDIDFVGIDRKKIFSCIFKNKKNTIIEMKNEFSWETKTMLNEHSYVIPFLYS